MLRESMREFLCFVDEMTRRPCWPLQTVRSGPYFQAPGKSRVDLMSGHNIGFLCAIQMLTYNEPLYILL